MNPKRLFTLLAVGMNYQFQAPSPSFFQTAPSAESVLSESLENRKNVHPVEALKTLPGVVVLGSEVTTYSSSLFLRGASADHTLFIWNDLRADDFTSPAGSTDPFSVGSEFSNDIKVLKGPQSLLYGTQALGGVILINDRKDLDSSFTLAGGSLNTVKAVTELRSNFGEEKKTFVALGGSGLASEGLSSYKAQVPQGPNGALETDAQSKKSGTILVTTELPERSEVQALWNHFESVSSDDVPPYDDLNAQSIRSGDQWKVRFKKEWQAKLNSTFLVAGQRSHRESVNPPDASNSGAYEAVMDGNRFIFQNQNSWQAPSSLWHFGVESADEQALSSKHEQSLYLVNDWNFTHSDLSWGVRGSCEDRKSCTSVYQLSAQWHWPEQQQSVFAIVSTGLKRPTLYQLYSRNGNATLAAERSQAYELGFIQRWDPTHKVKLSLFQNRFSELIDYNFSTTRYYNINKATTVGVEFLHQYIGTKFETELSFAKISAKDDGTNLRLLRRSEYQSAGTVTWALSDSLKWLHEVIYKGEREDTSDSGSRLVLPATLLMNTALLYKYSTDGQIFFRVNNLGNSTYEDIYGYLTPSRFYWAGIKISF